VVYQHGRGILDYDVDEVEGKIAACSPGFLLAVRLKL